MFSVVRKSRKLNLPVDIQLHLFDTMIAPILLYGAEVWGFEKANIIETFHLQYCKLILKVKKCTSNNMVYGELGRFPLDIAIKGRMIGFWQRIICGKKDKIAFMLYSILYQMHCRDFFPVKMVMYCY